MHTARCWSFIFPDPRLLRAVPALLLSLTGTGNEVTRQKPQESCVMGVPSTGCYTKRNPRMVCIWGHMELPWQCCKMDARFHNPPSAIILNLSHITFLASLKWQTFAKNLKHNSATSSSHIPSLVRPSKIRNGSSNEPEEPSHSGGSSKKRARSSLEVIPCEVKAVGKGSGSQVAEEMIKCQTPGSTKWQLNPGEMPSCSNSELRSTRGHNYD